MSEWTSARDGLPAETGHYLVSMPDWNTHTEACFCSKHTGWEPEVAPKDTITQKITHWMPLSEPPCREGA